MTPIERLRVVYAMLPGIPDEKLDLDRWRYDDAFEYEVVSDQALINACDTTGCAVGFACAYPPLVAEGLWWKSNLTPAFGLDTGWPAVEKFFDLTKGESLYLFGGQGHGAEGRRRVMTRIARYLRKKGVITPARYAVLRDRDDLLEDSAT